MKLSQIIYKIHKQIESKELQSIPQKEMAERLGISLSTYTEWLRDANQPIAMRAILDMLTMLNDEDIVHTIRTWEFNKNVDSN